MEQKDNNSINITQRYFSLSNAGDLSVIESLIHAEATYSSANTGLYYGRTDIMSMMQGFYSAHRKLHWQIDGIEALNEFITEVHFSCDSTDANGQQAKRSGVERLVVVDGLIRHIEVR